MDQFDLRAISGLAEVEAAKRLQEEGHNEIPSTTRQSIFAIVLEVVREPMFLLLVACGAIYLVLGDVQEALMLLGFVFVVMGITIYQERKTERALEALRDLSSPRALVIRDGEQKRIAGREVVRGDILVLAEGDRVPADAVLLWCINLSVDESLLTGESVPVRKVAWDRHEQMGRAGGDDLPFVFSGTLVVQGQGIAQVTATGIHTEIGKIGKALQTVEPEETLLQRETGRLVRNLAVVGLFLCALVVVRLRADPGRLAQRASGRHYPGHGHAAGRISGGADHLPGPGRLAHLPEAGAHPPRAGRRDPGRGHRAVRGQDGHADPEPHVGQQAFCQGRAS